MRELSIFLNGFQPLKGFIDVRVVNFRPWTWEQSFPKYYVIIKVLPNVFFSHIAKNFIIKLGYDMGLGCQR